MNLAAEILVVILSIFLAIFLILAIILTIYLISLTRQIRKITDSAGKAVDDAGSIITKTIKMVSPIYIAELIANFIKRNHKTKEEEKTDVKN